MVSGYEAEFAVFVSFLVLLRAKEFYFYWEIFWKDWYLYFAEGSIVRTWRTQPDWFLDVPHFSETFLCVADEIAHEKPSWCVSSLCVKGYKLCSFAHGRYRIIVAATQLCSNRIDPQKRPSAVLIQNIFLNFQQFLIGYTCALISRGVVVVDSIWTFKHTCHPGHLITDIHVVFNGKLLDELLLSSFQSFYIWQVILMFFW